jgi:hypothetical protein
LGVDLCLFIDRGASGHERDLFAADRRDFVVQCISSSRHPRSGRDDAKENRSLSLSLTSLEGAALSAP